MKRLIHLAVLLLGLVGVAGAAPVDGAWEGKLQTGGVTLRIVFHVKSEADGSMRSTMDSPDQNAFGVPVDSTAFVDNRLRCEIKAIGGVYEGVFNESERKLKGTWTQFGIPMPLDLEAKTETARNRPQEPKLPYPYVAEEVTFENKAANVKFAGTFTRPTKGKTFPTVLLITGSGPQDRDESLMGHKPFLVLSDYLTRRGIAVLRVDDRGVGGTTFGNAPGTSVDFAQDVLSAIDYLKSRGDVNKKEIGLIGHSEGGLVAPLVATQSKDVAFIVLLAGPGAKGRDIMEKQAQLALEVQKVPAIVSASQLQLQKKLLDIAMQSPDVASAMTAFDSWWATYTKEGAGPFAAGGGQESMMKTIGDNLRGQLKGIMNPWMKYFLSYDPAPTLSKVHCPVLAINGTLDLQVPPTQNLPIIEASLKAAGNSDYTIKTLDGLNHLFQHAKTGALSEYSEIEETFDPMALQIVGDWIDAHTGKRN